MLVASIGVTACAPAGTSTDARPVAVGRNEERVRIGSFSHLRAVTVSRRYVFAASGTGISVYDRQFERWLPPLTADDDVTDQPITALAGDPVEEALWYGVPGAIVMYRPFTGQIQRTMVVGVPDLIVFERTAVGGAVATRESPGVPSGVALGMAEVLVRSSGQWTRVSRVGLATPLSGAPSLASVYVPPRLPEIYAQFPTLRMQPDQLLRGTSARQARNRALAPVRVTSGAVSPERSSDVWLGTDGDGLFRIDANVLQGRALPFGLFDAGVGALAPAADGVWAGGIGGVFEGGAATRGGVTFATSDLQRWRWIEGTIAVPLAGRRVTSMASWGSRLWLGTERGLVRIRTDSTNDLAQWTAFAGLPDDRVLSLAPRGDGAWVGTARGLGWASDSGTRPVVLPARDVGGVAITALQLTGDSLWVGTPNGLLVVSASPPNGASPAARGASVARRLQVQALAASDSVLLIATDRDLWQLVLRDGQVPTRIDALDTRAIAPVTRLAMDDRTIVVAGRGGLLLQSRRTGAIRVVSRVGEALASPTDVLLTRDWLWIGTPRELVRWYRTADGLVP
jgi:hypothetical protein